MNICQNLSQRVIAPSLTSCNERGRACVRVGRGKTRVKLYHATRKSRQPKSLSRPPLNFFDKNDNSLALTSQKAKIRRRAKELTNGFAIIAGNEKSMISLVCTRRKFLSSGCSGISGTECNPSQRGVVNSRKSFLSVCAQHNSRSFSLFWSRCDVTNKSRGYSTQEYRRD